MKPVMASSVRPWHQDHQVTPQSRFVPLLLERPEDDLVQSVDDPQNLS